MSGAHESHIRSCFVFLASPLQGWLARSRAETSSQTSTGPRESQAGKNAIRWLFLMLRVYDVFRRKIPTKSRVSTQMKKAFRAELTCRTCKFFCISKDEDQD